MISHCSVNLAVLFEGELFRCVDGVALCVVISLRYATLFFAKLASKSNKRSKAFFGHVNPFFLLALRQAQGIRPWIT